MGAKVRLNATQADAYFLFLKEGILNFYTLGFYRRCPCRCGPCKNRTTYPRWLDKHVEWDGAPPPDTTNEFQIFDDKLVCCQKLTMMLFNIFFGFLPFLQIFAATCKQRFFNRCCTLRPLNCAVADSYKLRLSNLKFGGIQPEFSAGYSCGAMFGKYLSTMCWGFHCCGIWSARLSCSA